MQPPQIALIGTDGSGKTVLTTVLAKKLAKAQNGVWLHPQGAKTEKYVEVSWHTLNNGEWIPSTPPGTLYELKWMMNAGNRTCPMRVIDSAGQDLRNLFSDEKFHDPNLAEYDQYFIEYIHDSTILLILVNLTDFIGEPDANRRIDNAVILRSVLDKLAADNVERQIAFVFTAYDLYEETIREKYGTVEQYIETELPYLHNAHVAGKPVQCFAVAAVADTEEKNDSNGVARRVPVPNFHSEGLQPLIDWLAKAVMGDIVRQEEEEERKRIEAKNKIIERENVRAEAENALRQKEKKELFQKIGVIIIVLLVLDLVMNTGVVFPARLPAPEFVDTGTYRPDCTKRERTWAEWRAGHPDRWICVEHKVVSTGIKVKNNGWAGKVEIVFSIQGKEGTRACWY